MENFDRFFDNPHLTLFPQQKEIIKEALLKKYFLILGEPGVGKTLLAVYILKILLSLKLIDRAFILTKNEVLQKFKSEILRHISFLETSDIALLEDNTDRDLFGKKAVIYLCDYNQARLVYEFYAGALPSKSEQSRRRIQKVFPISNSWAVILDEVQATKNIKSDIHKIVYTNIKGAGAKIATSGTPTEKIEEYYSVFKIINENIIDQSYFYFMHLIAYLRGNTYQILRYKKEGVEKIKNKIDNYMSILNKEDIKEMVSRDIIDLEVTFTEDFKKEYDKEIEFLQRTTKQNGVFKRREIATLIQPIYNKVKEVSDTNPRFNKFISLVKRITATEKLIIWERSPEIMDNLSDYFNKIGLKNLVIYGDVNKYERAGIIEKFDTDLKIKILIISFLTTAEAWEIPSRPDCKRMMFYSLPDRIINFQQCIDRLHRLNSQEPVTIYRFVLKDSIDEWAKDLLEYKQKINDGLIRKEDFEQIEVDSYERFLGINKKFIVS